MVDTKQWPAMWRREYGVPLQKVPNPEDENQLRIISLTAKFSKIFENMVIKWLYKYIGHILDPQHFGGREGSSITHYMIELVNFILYNQDLTNPNAVLVLMADYSKAFNRQDHNTLITILSDMGCPRWLLEIIIAFLSDRELVVRHKGKYSSCKDLPGGTPQGTRLGMFLFLVLINFAGIPADQLSLNIGDEITNRKRNTLKPTHMKFIDDLSLATAINLKENLVVAPDLPRPLSYHERTGHTLPLDRNNMQQHFNDLMSHANKHKMVINEDKSKVMLFNQGRKYDFLPAIETANGNILHTVDEIRLLGLVVRSDLRWQGNTDQMCKKAYGRLWMIRNLKKLGVTKHDLLDVYYKQCRSILELAVPAWAPGLTSKECKQIERVQKTALAVILGESFKSYSQALKKLSAESLKCRRRNICLKFAIQAQKSERFSRWFADSNEQKPNFNTRHFGAKMKHTFKPVKTRTRRYLRSPLPYLTNLLNEHFDQKARK